MDISMILTIGLSAVTTGFVVTMSVALAKMNMSLKHLKDSNQKEHGEIYVRQSEIFKNVDGKQRIKDIVAEAEDYMDIKDTGLLCFTQTCQDVTLEFYGQVIGGGVNKVTEEDIYRGTNKAIQTCIESCNRNFEQEFIDMFWEAFEQNAINIQFCFVEIINDVMANGKESRVTRALESYLFEQLKLLNTERIIYLRQEKKHNF